MTADKLNEAIRIKNQIDELLKIDNELIKIKKEIESIGGIYLRDEWSLFKFKIPFDLVKDWFESESIKMIEKIESLQKEFDQL